MLYKSCAEHKIIFFSIGESAGKTSVYEYIGVSRHKSRGKEAALTLPIPEHTVVSTI